MLNLKSILEEASVNFILNENATAQKLIEKSDFLQKRIRKAAENIGVVDDQKVFQKLNDLISEIPEEAYLYQLRSNLFAREGKLKEAIIDLDHAISLEPSSAFFFTRGIAKAINQQYDEALKDFDICLKLDRDDMLAWFYAAKTMLQIKSEKKVLTAIFKLYSMISDNLKVEEATDELIEAIESTGQSEFINNVGLLLSMGEGSDRKIRSAGFTIAGASSEVTDLALEYFATAIDLNSKNDRAYFERAKIFQKLGKKAEAATDIKTVKQLAPFKYNIVILPSEETRMEFIKRGFSLN
jgi:tetratricopeptide (TPR) repeat protein